MRVRFRNRMPNGCSLSRCRSSRPPRMRERRHPPRHRSPTGRERSVPPRIHGRRTRASVWFAVPRCRRRRPRSRDRLPHHARTTTRGIQAGVRGELDEFRVSRDQLKKTESMPREFLERYRGSRCLSRSTCCCSGTARTRFSPTGAFAWLSRPRGTGQEAACGSILPTGRDLDSGPYPSGVGANRPTCSDRPTIPPRASGCSKRPAGSRARTVSGARAGEGGPRTARARAGQGRRNLAEILRSAYAKVGVVLAIAAVDAAVLPSEVRKGSSTDT